MADEQRTPTQSAGSINSTEATEAWMARQHEPTRVVLDEIAAERQRQDAKWGEQNHPDGTGQFPETIEADVARMACENAADGGYLDWLHILREETAEAFAEADPTLLRVELLQVAAVAVAWIEGIDRRLAQHRADMALLRDRATGPKIDQAMGITSKEDTRG